MICLASSQHGFETVFRVVVPDLQELRLEELAVLSPRPCEDQQGPVTCGLDGNSHQAVPLEVCFKDDEVPSDAPSDALPSSA